MRAHTNHTQCMYRISLHTNHNVFPHRDSCPWTPTHTRISIMFWCLLLLLSRSESPKMLLFQRVGGVYHSPSQWNQKTCEKVNKYKIETSIVHNIGHIYIYYVCREHVCLLCSKTHCLVFRIWYSSWVTHDPSIQHWKWYTPPYWRGFFTSYYALHLLFSRNV